MLEARVFTIQTDHKDPTKIGQGIPTATTTAGLYWAVFDPDSPPARPFKHGS
jgi:hypothetical protein